jgi:hypothetical protein
VWTALLWAVLRTAQMLQGRVQEGRREASISGIAYRLKLILNIALTLINQDKGP